MMKRLVLVWFCSVSPLLAGLEPVVFDLGYAGPHPSPAESKRVMPEKPRFVPVEVWRALRAPEVFQMDGPMNRRGLILYVPAEKAGFPVK